jgi:hypothetical protein
LTWQLVTALYRGITYSLTKGCLCSQCVPDPKATVIIKPEPIALHQQCGGEGYKGVTQCAYGLVCVFIEKYYSQCQPDPAFAGKSEQTVKIYGQCGGVTYAGPTKCEFGLKCSWVNAVFSQCLPDAAQPAGVAPAGLWQQCGGSGFKGVFPRVLSLIDTQIDRHIDP